MPTIAVFADVVNLPDTHSIMYVRASPSLPTMVLHRDASRVYLQFEYRLMYGPSWNGFQSMEYTQYTDAFGLKVVQDCIAHIEHKRLCYYKAHLIEDEIPSDKCAQCKADQRK